MGFVEDLESVEAHQGTTSRFSVKIRNRMLEQTADSERREFGSETSLLIGERGQNLSALEHILKKILLLAVVIMGIMTGILVLLII